MNKLLIVGELMVDGQTVNASPKSTIIPLSNHPPSTKS
jgi:hypothetical protein